MAAFFVPEDDGRNEKRTAKKVTTMNDSLHDPAPNPPSAPATNPPPPPAPVPPPAYAAYAPAPYAPAPAPPPMIKSPAVAGLLSFLPGLGHVYLGLYQRAVIFFAVWAILITVVGHAPMPAGLMIPFWWFFVLIDAVRQAKAINSTGAPESNLLVGEKPLNVSGGLAFGIFLVLIGIFFLIDRFVRIDLSFLYDFWPVFLIAFGAWQIWLYVKAKKDAEAAKTRE
jgi:hypothetical protein